jgi:carbon-monoxide dehydrogenase small subunit
MTDFPTFRFTLNGRPVAIQAAPMQRLLEVVRDQGALTATKDACGEGECGVCTVLVDGQAVLSCLLPIVQVEGAEVRTVEGLAPNGLLNTLQDAFLACGGTQCGFCTPGILMMATAHLQEQGTTDRQTLREALAGNICRCTGYGPIIASIQHASTRE